MSSSTAPLMNRYITSYNKHLSIKHPYDLPPSSFYYYIFQNIITPVVRNNKNKQSIFFKYDRVIKELEYTILLNKKKLILNR